MKVFVKFQALATTNQGLSFEDIEAPHDAGSPEQVDVFLINGEGEKVLLGPVRRTDIKRLANAIQERV